MRATALLLSALAAGSASAASISGTFTVTFPGFTETGQAPVHMDLRLMCSLTCGPAAPDLHYRVATGTDAWYVSAPTETAAYISAGFGSNDNGINVADIQSVPAGVALNFIAKGASCHCGNAIGEGGFVDVAAPMLVIPPFTFVGTSKGRAGDDWYQIVNAKPKGSETVTVKFLGAGLDTTVTRAAADFTGNSSYGSTQVIVRPTEAGTLTVTSTLMPYGVSHTATVTVDPGNGGTAGGTGGSGGGGEAGGAGGGGGEEVACTAAPASALLPLALLALARRRRTR